MSTILSPEVGLSPAETYKPEMLLKEQKKRDHHYVISLIMSQDWSGESWNGGDETNPAQHNRRLSKLRFPQARIVLIENIRYPTRNTFRDMVGTGNEPEQIMYEKTAADQVDELLKAFQIFGVSAINALTGAHPSAVVKLQRALLPSTTNEADYCYPAMKEFLNNEAPRNLTDLDGDLIIVGERVKRELLKALDVAYRYANKHVADANNEIAQSKTGRGGKFAYDSVDIAMMKFLAVKAKFEVSPDTGLQQESKADIHVIQQANNEAVSLEAAALRQELAVLKMEMLSSKQQSPVAEEREMKRCKACAADVYKEATYCFNCRLNPDKKPTS